MEYGLEEKTTRFKVGNKKLKILLVFGFLFLALNSAPPVGAVSSISSDNYRIVWPNLNMGAGTTSSTGYKLNTTTGQTAPGLYSSTGYRVKAGFQYIHSIIPFAFSLSVISLNFGTLTANVLTNEQTLTLTVDSGSAGGYQVKVEESDPLTSTSGKTIVDTTCDAADSCDQDTDFGTWTDTGTYGFGYTMSGDDVPAGFSSGTKFRNFADAPGESPVKIMGKTPAEGGTASKNKTATLTARINISNTQAAGTYRNVLTFIAIPIF